MLFIIFKEAFYLCLLETMSLDQQKRESRRTIRNIFLDLGINECVMFPRKKTSKDNLKYMKENIKHCVEKGKVKEVLETSIVDVETVQLLHEARILFKKKLYSGKYDTLFGDNLVIQEGRLFHEIEPEMDSKEYVCFKSCKKSVNEVINSVHLSCLLPKEFYEKIDKSILDENMIAVLEEVLLSYWTQQEKEEKRWKEIRKQQENRKQSEKKSEKEWEQEAEVVRIGIKNDLFSQLRKIINGMMRSYVLLDNSAFFQNMRKDEYADFLNEFLLKGESFIEQIKKSMVEGEKEKNLVRLLDTQVDLLFE